MQTERNTKATPAGRLADAPGERVRNPFVPTPIEAARMIHDKAVRLMDARWGTDVLPTLVSPEMGAKFARWCCRRDDAIEAGDDDAAINAFENIVRGLQKLDEVATAAGLRPLEIARWWSTRADDGRTYLFTQDEDDARVAARQGRWEGYQIWSLPEVIRVLEDKSFESVLKAKQLWPEAAIVKVVRPAVDWRVGDEVPF